MDQIKAKSLANDGSVYVVIDGPRIIFRPEIVASPPVENLEISESIIRRGFLAVLPRGVDAEKISKLLLNKVASKLEEASQKQKNGGDHTAVHRIMWFDDAGNLIARIDGTATGDLDGTDLIFASQGGHAITFRFSLATSSISLWSQKLRIPPKRENHAFFETENNSDIKLRGAIEIPLLGPDAGCLTGGSQIAAGCAALGAMRAVTVFSGLKPKKTGGGVGGPRRPLFNLGAVPLLAGSSNGKGPINIDLQLDLASPFNEDATYLVPKSTKEDEWFLSGFSTDLGHSLLMQPITEVGKLPPRFVFSSFPRKVDIDGKSATQVSHSLSLIGSFSIKPQFEKTTFGLIAKENRPFGVLLGLLPSETAVVAANMAVLGGASTARMEFKLGPSVDPRLPTEEVSLASEEPALSHHLGENSEVKFSTSWCRILSPNASDMLLEMESPDNRTLPLSGNLKEEERTPIMLDHLPQKRVVNKYWQPTDIAGFLPAMPVRGMDPNLIGEYESFEKLVLSRERAKLTQFQSSTMPFQLDEEVKHEITPLGFQLERKAGRIIAITFATTPDKKESDPPLAFRIEGIKGTPILPPLAEAIGSNRFFLVADQIPSVYTDISGSYKTDISAKVMIGNWPFIANLPGPELNMWIGGGADKPRCFILVKAYPGKSIFQLVKDPKTWAEIGTFVIGTRATGGMLEPKKVEEASKYLIDACDTISKKANDNSSANAKSNSLLYKDINNILISEDWSGVVVLHCGIELGSLPQQLKGLMGGIKTEKLRAEYFAIEACRLPASEDRLPDRLSALVDYDDSAEPAKPAKPGDKSGGTDNHRYGFKVDRLAVGFANGEIQSFLCKARFYLGSLFDGNGNIKSRQRGSKDPFAYEVKDSNLVIDGRYEKHRIGNTFSEQYTFESADEYAYCSPDGDKAVIQEVQINRLAFITEETKSDDNFDIVKSRLDFDGRLKFGSVNKEIFGIEDVQFADLGIKFDFKLPKFSGSVSDLKFQFSPKLLRFDFGKRKTENTSALLASFPLKFRGFNLFGNSLTLPKLGYFGFGNLANGSGNSPDFNFRYGLDFDLDLGSLGELASKLKDFKMKVLFAFCENGEIWDWDGKDFKLKEVKFGWAVGFKFDGAGGEGLDLGIQNIIRLKADKYDIQNYEYKDSNNKTITAKAIYALKAQIEVLGKKFPDDDQGINLFLFVDPSKLGGEAVESSVGWFAARKPSDDSSKSKNAGGALDLKMLAIGQRVDPAKDFSGKTTRDLVKQIGYLAGEFTDKGLSKDPKKRAEEILKKVSEKIGKQLVFDPLRGWSIGFEATFFERVGIRFGMRDPDLYGLEVSIWKEPQKDPSKSTEEPLFSVDIMYRRLTDKLGVYSTEILPPPSWRQLEFGAVSVTIPAIAFEIFTDGGFGIDLGYPVGNNFSRSFGVQVFPFIGSGGTYFRRISGPGAELVPSKIGYLKKKDDNPIFPENSDELCYNPVVEAGVGFRVGLGKEIQKGPLRAGLSITVYALLEGAYAVLRISDRLSKEIVYAPASTFIRVRGVVGVLGELYGYVDFGIVKAGVMVRVFVEMGIDLKTDFATTLFIRAGVDVVVVVVIGKICVFGACVEISISFSYSSVIEYSTTIGSDRNPKLYSWGNQAIGIAGTNGLLPNRFETASPKFDKWQSTIQPEEWRKDGKGDKAAIHLVFAPDMTLATDSGKAVAEAVLMLVLLNERSKEQPLNGADDLGIALAAWTIKEGFGKTGKFKGALRTWQVTLTELEGLAILAAGGFGRLHADRRSLMPNIDRIENFFRDNTNATINSHQDLQQQGKHTPLAGLFVPIPPKSKVIRKGFNAYPEYDSVTFAEKVLVDEAFDKKIDLTFEKLIQLDRKPSGPSLMAANKESLAEVIFEEYISLLIRTLTNRMHIEAQKKLSEPEQQPHLPLGDRKISVGELIDLLTRQENAEHTPATEAFAAASRFFMHGPRLPLPNQFDAAIPPTINQADQSTHHGLYRMAWHQIPLKGAADQNATITLEIPAGAIGNVAATRLEVSLNADKLKDLAKIIEIFKTTPIEAEMEMGNLNHQRIRRFPALTPLVLQAGEDKFPLLRFSDEFRRQLFDHKNEVNLNVVHEALEHQNSAINTFSINDESRQVIAIQVKLRPILKPTIKSAEVVKDAFEIMGMSEPERVLLDIFEDGNCGDAIESVALYQPDTDGFKLLQDMDATVVQTNLAAEVKIPQGGNFGVLSEPVSAKHVAVLSENLTFVEIVRRAAIVNSGGYSLMCNGIKETDNKNTASGENGRNDLRVLLVITLKPLQNETVNSVGHWARANAVIDQKFVPAKIDQRPVDVFNLGLTSTESMVEPGVLPILVKRFDPNEDKSGVGALRSRFSMLAYDVEIDGKLEIRSSESLAVGPTRWKEDPDEEKLEAEFRQNRDGKSLFYRLALPIWKLREKSNPYDVVGTEVKVNGVWRDVYGNDLPFPLLPAFKQTFYVPYSDRLIPLNDAPGLLLGWWPGKNTGEIFLAIGFDALNRFKRLINSSSGDNDLATISTDTVQKTLDRDCALLTRLAYQLEDSKASVIIGTSFWVDGPGKVWSQEEKMWLVGLVRRFLKLCSDYVHAIGDKNEASAKELLTLAEEHVKNLEKPSGEDKALSLTLKFNSTIYNNPENPFVEVSTWLKTSRSRPETQKLDPPPDVLSSSIPIPLPFRSNDTDIFAQFGRTIEEFADAIKKIVTISGIGPLYSCATGYSDTPGLTEKAVWLVRKDLIPSVTIWQNTTPRFLALPPISVHLQNFNDLEIRLFNPDSNEENVGKAEIQKFDADDLARRALNQLDAVLSGDVIAALVGANAGDSRRANREAIQQILNVKDSVARVLGARLSQILEEDNGWFLDNPAIKDTVKNALSDRFKKRLGVIYDVETIALYPAADPDDKKSSYSAPPNAEEKAFASVHGSIIPPNQEAVSSRPENEYPKISFESFPVRIGSNTDSRSQMLMIACDTPPTYGVEVLTPPTDFQITHIQRKERPDPSQALGEPGRYRPTAWLKLVETVGYKLPTSLKIPLVLRKYPTPPVIEKNGFKETEITSGKSLAERLRTACSWNAQTIWSWSPEPQDKLYIKLAYNPPPRKIETEFGFKAEDACQTSFEDKVYCRAESIAEEDVRMSFAFATFVMETESVSKYLQISDVNKQSLALRHISKAALLLKRILEIHKIYPLSAEPKVLTDILSVEEPASEIVVTFEQSKTNAPVTLTVPNNQPIDSITLSESKKSGSIKLSNIENGPRIRRLEVAGLNILSIRRFETHIDLTRNKDVSWKDKNNIEIKKSINKPFIYTFPTVCSFEPVTPRLNRDQEIFFDSSQQGIDGHIQRLIEGLVSEISTDEELLTGIVCDLVVTFEPEIINGVKSYGGKCIKVFPDFPLSPLTRSQAEATLANVIRDWLANQQPNGWGTNNPPGSIIFDVKIYERIKNQQILRLQRCVLPLKLITYS